MSDKLARLLATFFYVGYFPVAPGSLASLVGLLIFLVLHSQTWLYVIVLVGVTIVGFPASEKMEQLSGEKDPSCIVIDEVAGILLSLMFLPITFPVLITAFFVFRAFDMFKIYPVAEFEKLPGAKGVMCDDLVAGVYTNIVMQIAIRIGDGALF